MRTTGAQPTYRIVIVARIVIAQRTAIADFVTQLRFWAVGAESPGWHSVCPIAIRQVDRPAQSGGPTRLGRHAADDIEHTLPTQAETAGRSRHRFECRQGGRAQGVGPRLSRHGVRQSARSRQTRSSTARSWTAPLWPTRSSGCSTAMASRRRRWRRRCPAAPSSSRRSRCP